MRNETSSISFKECFVPAFRLFLICGCILKKQRSMLAKKAIKGDSFNISDSSALILRLKCLRVSISASFAYFFMASTMNRIARVSSISAFHLPALKFSVIVSSADLSIMATSCSICSIGFSFIVMP